GLRDLLRLHGTELVAPGGADVRGHGRDLFVVQHAAEGRHLLAAVEDLADDMVSVFEVVVARQVRADRALALVAVTHGAVLLERRSAVLLRHGGAACWERRRRRSLQGGRPTHVPSFRTTSS